MSAEVTNQQSVRSSSWSVAMAVVVVLQDDEEVLLACFFFFFGLGGPIASNRNLPKVSSCICRLLFLCSLLWLEKHRDNERRRNPRPTSFALSRLLWLLIVRVVHFKIALAKASQLAKSLAGSEDLVDSPVHLSKTSSSSEAAVMISLRQVPVREACPLRFNLVSEQRESFPVSRLRKPLSVTLEAKAGLQPIFKECSFGKSKVSAREVKRASFHDSPVPSISRCSRRTPLPGGRVSHAVSNDFGETPVCDTLMRVSLPGSIVLLPLERVRGRTLMTLAARGGDWPGGANKDCNEVVGVEGLGGKGAGAGAGAGGGGPLKSIAIAESGVAGEGRAEAEGASRRGFLMVCQSSFKGDKSVILGLPFTLSSSNSGQNFPMD